MGQGGPTAHDRLCHLRSYAYPGVNAVTLMELKSLPDPRRTARNLRLIREARTARGEAYTWSEQFEQALLAKAKG